jgi:hypothetical protein
MANAAIFDPATNRVLQYLESVNTPSYAGRPDVVIDPAINKALPLRYWKHSGGNIVEMSQPEKDAVDLEISTAAVLGNRAGSKLEFNKTYFKAFIKTLIDEINILRADIDAMSKEAPQITVRNRPPRTIQQLKNAVIAEIDSGNSD